MFELLKWVTDKEFGVQLGLQTKGSTTLGGRPDVYADERILNAPQYTRQMQKAQLDSVTQIKEPSVTPYNFRAPEVYKVRDDRHDQDHHRRGQGGARLPAGASTARCR